MGNCLSVDDNRLAREKELDALRKEKFDPLAPLPAVSGTVTDIPRLFASIQSDDWEEFDDTDADEPRGVVVICPTQVKVKNGKSILGPAKQHVDIAMRLLDHSNNPECTVESACTEFAESMKTRLLKRQQPLGNPDPDFEVISVPRKPEMDLGVFKWIVEVHIFALGTSKTQIESSVISYFAINSQAKTESSKGLIVQLSMTTKGAAPYGVTRRAFAQMAKAVTLKVPTLPAFDNGDESNSSKSNSNSAIDFFGGRGYTTAPLRGDRGTVSFPLNWAMASQEALESREDEGAGSSSSNSSTLLAVLLSPNATSSWLVSVSNDGGAAEQEESSEPISRVENAAGCDGCTVTTYKLENPPTLIKYCHRRGGREEGEGNNGTVMVKVYSENDASDVCDETLARITASIQIFNTNRTSSPPPLRSKFFSPRVGVSLTLPDNEDHRYAIHEMLYIDPEKPVLIYRPVDSLNARFAGPNREAQFSRVDPTIDCSDVAVLMRVTKEHWGADDGLLQFNHGFLKNPQKTEVIRWSTSKKVGELTEELLRAGVVLVRRSDEENEAVEKRIVFVEILHKREATTEKFLTELVEIVDVLV